MSSGIPTKQAPKRLARKKMSQERLMILFTIFFVVGIVLLVILPPDPLVRGLVMTVYSVSMFWLMFRFGI